MSTQNTLIIFAHVFVHQDWLEKACSSIRVKLCLTHPLFGKNAPKSAQFWFGVHTKNSSQQFGNHTFFEGFGPEIKKIRRIDPGSFLPDASIIGQKNVRKHTLFWCGGQPKNISQQFWTLDAWNHFGLRLHWKPFCTSTLVRFYLKGLFIFYVNQNTLNKALFWSEIHPKKIPQQFRNISYS